VRLTRAQLQALAPPPKLSAQALRAREFAQKALLGQSGLFEDALGQPIATEPPQSLAEIGIIVPADAEAGGDNEDAESEGPESPATQLGEAAAAAMSLDGIDDLPGSGGIAATPTFVERIDGNSLGLYVPLQGHGPNSLAAFHQALRQFQNNAPSSPTPRKVRILAYGASHTQADIYTEYLRRYLQFRFGNGGQGFIATARPNRWFRHLNFAIEQSRGWKIDRAQKKDAREDGYYGLLGASASSRSKRDYLRIVPRSPDDETKAVTLYELMYLGQPRGGKAQIFIDGKLSATISTRHAQTDALVHTFRAPLGHHVVEIRPEGNGEVRLLGLNAERDEAGIVVDTLGISGTRAANQLKWNEPTWRKMVARRDPALYMLAFGTNEATDGDRPIADYESQLRTVLSRFSEAAPNASCLLIGPGDFAEKFDEQTWIQVPRLLEIAKAQEKVAKEFRCAYWDTLAFMGGAGTMALWTNSYPQMASRDHIHLTRRGYVRMGMQLTDALMDGFDP
jgi:lysophospholipase L1-like esterase